MERLADDGLQWEGRGAVPIVAEAGDVALFVSDIWHRRLPTQSGDPGRMFVQCHYGRRDLAQRIRPASLANHLSGEAVARARTRAGEDARRAPSFGVLRQLINVRPDGLLSHRFACPGREARLARWTTTGVGSPALTIKGLGTIRRANCDTRDVIIVGILLGRAGGALVGPMQEFDLTESDRDGDDRRQ